LTQCPTDRHDSRVGAYVRHSTRIAVFLAACAVVPSFVHSAEAQSPEDRRAASEAYDRGSEAYLSESWAEAARWFEVAHRRAPIPAALVQAIRAHRRAGNLERAGTLALRAERLYPEDATARETAAETIAEASPALVRIDVVCEGCTVQVGGVILENPSIFVPPDTEHRVVAQFPTGDRSELVIANAGEIRQLTFSAPEGPVLPERDPDREGNETPERFSRSDDDSGLSPAFFLTGLGLTAVAGAILIWSGLDTLAGVDEYERVRSMALLEQGQDKELRTNILIGVTAGLGVITAALLMFTSWSGGDEEEARSSPALRSSVAAWSDGAMLELEGAF
jgi:hypothetical protein